MKKIISYSLGFLIVITLIAFIYKGNNSNYQNILTVSSKQLDANTISTWFRNNGSFNRDPLTGNAGFFWPKGTNISARYASGLWLGAKVGNDTLVALAEYEYEYLPGYTDGSGLPQGKDDPLYRIYRLTNGVNDADRQNWPNALLGNSNQGAPVFYDNQSNSWKPLDFGTQTMFYRYTDSYPEAHINRAGSTNPLKADIKQTNFSLNIPGVLGRVVFSSFTVINRNTQSWNNAYFTIWSDDDVGNARDDKIGCDSSYRLGYTYNAYNYDSLYGYAPPAVGFYLIKGALSFTGNNYDTAFICNNKTRVTKTQFRDMGMSSFNCYANGDPVNGDPRIYYETYRFMNGLTRGGNVINHPNGYPTKYKYNGDPEKNTGWVQQGLGDDERFMMITGPVNMQPGDTQTIVVAQIIAIGSSNVNSVTKLKEFSNKVTQYYNTCYAPTSFTVSGRVTYKDNGQPVNSGKVKALYYERTTSKIEVWDSTNIQSDGNYTLSNFPQDSMYIMFFQDDEDALNFVPTYYPSTTDWHQASIVYATQNLTNINGQVYRITNTTYPYSLSGQVLFNSYYGTQGIKDGIVYVMSGNVYKNFGISSDNGSYSVINLAAGSYSIVSNRIGFNNVNLNVNINTGNITNFNINLGSPIGINNSGIEIPTEFKLYQNYPNPFNPISKIKYQIPANVKGEMSNVKLIIYDILGKEVEILVNLKQTQGTYEINFNGTDYPSGVYFYQLVISTEQSTEIYRETRKMVLVK
jgi:hypothetical protein